jgi:hypothetical protein
MPVALLVDPDISVVARLRPVVEGAGFAVVGYTEFAAARQHMMDAPPAAVVANARLGAFNGVHLAYVARFAPTQSRCVIYADPHDAVLARESQGAGAFYVRESLLKESLPGILKSVLPENDRRHPMTLDRRRTFRGGRRATDRPELHAVARHSSR